MLNGNKEKSLIVYESEDGRVSFDVKLDQETVWLTQAQMGELFGTARENITMHIRNVLKEGELLEKSVCKNFLLTAKDGKNYSTKHYNLDAIISVGYRIVRHEAVA